MTDPNAPGGWTPIPISVLTGFLGSGKTTLLSRSHLLRHPGMAKTAVIINEFGEIGLDDLLVRRANCSIMSIPVRRPSS